MYSSNGQGKSIYVTKYEKYQPFYLSISKTSKQYIQVQDRQKIITLFICIVTQLFINLNFFVHNCIKFNYIDIEINVK